jgi:hypothetical protein
MALFMIGPWLFSVVDALSRPEMHWIRANHNKALWVLALLALPCVAAAGYLISVRPRLRHAKPIFGTQPSRRCYTYDPPSRMYAARIAVERLEHTFGGAAALSAVGYRQVDVWSGSGAATNSIWAICPWIIVKANATCVRSLGAQAAPAVPRTMVG